MDAVEFFKAWKRMCREYPECCENCPIYKAKGAGNGLCQNWVKMHPEKSIAIVEQWAKEHPAQTRQSEFLKLFPGVDADKTDGCLTLNPCIIYPKMREECSGKLCHECKKTFWLAEVEGNG